MAQLTPTQLYGQLVNITRFHPDTNIQNYVRVFIERIKNGLTTKDLTDADKKLLRWTELQHTLRPVPFNG